MAVSNEAIINYIADIGALIKLDEIKKELLSFLMPVKPNASSDEFNSPFFKENEKLCLAFDGFITGLGGKTKGKYNAFSYNILGYFDHPNEWQFRLGKSTSTEGHLLLSSEAQSILIDAEWIAQNIPSSYPDFSIKHKRSGNFLTRIFAKNQKVFSKYVLKSEDLNHPFIKDLMKKLEFLFDLEKVWSIELKNNILSIQLRTDDIHAKTIEKLLKMSFA